MEEYVCHFLIEGPAAARRVYYADDLPTAMAMHNAAMPEYSATVVSWVGPTGITFQMHDSGLNL